jgi:hypothetical protein
MRRTAATTTASPSAPERVAEAHGAGSLLIRAEPGLPETSPDLTYP